MDAHLWDVALRVALGVGAIILALTPAMIRGELRRRG